MGVFCLVFAMPLYASVYICLVVTCWERADLLALVCGVLLRVCYFPIGILGQVEYLIVLIPNLFTLTYFEYRLYRSSSIDSDVVTSNSMILMLYLQIL